MGPDVTGTRPRAHRALCVALLRASRVSRRACRPATSCRTWRHKRNRQTTHCGLRGTTVTDTTLLVTPYIALLLACVLAGIVCETTGIAVRLAEWMEGRE